MTSRAFSRVTGVSSLGITAACAYTAALNFLMALPVLSAWDDTSLVVNIITMRARISGSEVSFFMVAPISLKIGFSAVGLYVSHNIAITYKRPKTPNEKKKKKHIAELSGRYNLFNGILIFSDIIGVNSLKVF